MQYLSAASIFVATVALLEGSYILLAKPTEALNRRYFYMTLCITVWLFGAAFAYPAGTREEVVFWFRFCSFGFIFLHAFTLHFALTFSQLSQSPTLRRLAFLLYLPSLYFLYRSYTGLIVFRDFVKYNDLWTGVPDFASSDFRFLVLNYLTYYTLGAVLLALYRKRIRNKREKRKTSIVIFSILGTILLYNLEPFVLPLLTDYKPLVVAPLFSLFWISGIGYAVVRYRFLAWQPSVYSREILDNVDELILVFASDLRITYINYTAVTVLSRSDPNSLPADFDDCFENTAGIASALAELSEGKKRHFSCTLAFKAFPRIHFYSKFTGLRNEEGDVFGLIYLGKEIKDPSRFSVERGLTAKEQAVLRLLIRGKTLREIAEIEKISIRTVKAHSSHIYRKIGVRNKIELFNTLQTHSLFSDSVTEDSVFPLLEKKKKT